MFNSIVPTIVLFCGFYLQSFVTAAPLNCTDTVQCSLYSSDICSDPQYYTWMLDNCPKHCAVCTVGQQQQVNQVGVGKFMDENGGNPVCKDAIADCAQYGDKLCSDVRFYSWALDNCRKHCNHCDVGCVNKVSTCANYGPTLCTELSYYNWVEMNCRKYCARCS